MEGQKEVKRCSLFFGLSKRGKNILALDYMVGGIHILNLGGGGKYT